jgi:hypothetical protein
MGLLAERHAKMQHAAEEPRRKGRKAAPAKSAGGLPRPACQLQGRPVYSAEQLARMTPEQLRSIGLLLPPEPEWQEEWKKWDAEKGTGSPR